MGPQVAKTLDCCVTKVLAYGGRGLLPTVLRIRDAVLFWPMDPGWEKIRIRDPISGTWDKHLGSYFRELKNNFLGQKYLKSLSSQCWGAGSGMEKLKSGIRDPGWNNPNPA